MEQTLTTACVTSPALAVTPVRVAQDWGKLLREARDGGYSDKQAVVFIADNTRDKRANGDSRMFTKGYHEIVEAWVAHQPPRKGVDEAVVANTLADNSVGEPVIESMELSWYRAALEVAAKSLEMSADTIRLHAGEMSAQEMRSVQAVLRWKAAEIRGKAKKDIQG